MKKLNTSFKISKTTMLIPLFALTLHSCDETETGIVKDKIDNQVFLTPVNDTDYVYRVIDFDRGYNDRMTKNLYLNMNKGDTIVYCNRKRKTEIIPSYHHSALIGSNTYYNISKINGVKLYDLPDLVYKQKQEEEIKKLNEKYKNLQKQK